MIPLTHDEAKEFGEYLYDDAHCIECGRRLDDHTPDEIKACLTDWQRDNRVGEGEC